MLQLHEVAPWSLSQEVYALKLTADGAVSQAEGTAEPKPKAFHPCMEGLKSNIPCRCERKVGLLMIATCVAVLAEKCVRNPLQCPVQTDNVGWG